MNIRTEWLRKGTTWCVFTLVAAAGSLAAAAGREDGWGPLIVQWLLVAIEIFCFVRMVVCFRRSKRAGDRS